MNAHDSKKGTWIITDFDEEYNCDIAYCSICDCELEPVWEGDRVRLHFHSFCPNCGAEMVNICDKSNNNGKF